jgi:hypothetical protein
MFAPHGNGPNVKRQASCTKLGHRPLIFVHAAPLQRRRAPLLSEQQLYCIMLDSSDCFKESSLEYLSVCSDITAPSIRLERITKAAGPSGMVVHTASIRLERECQRTVTISCPPHSMCCPTDLGFKCVLSLVFHKCVWLPHSNRSNQIQASRLNDRVNSLALFNKRPPLHVCHHRQCHVNTPLQQSEFAASGDEGMGVQTDALLYCCEAGVRVVTDCEVRSIDCVRTVHSMVDTTLQTCNVTSLQPCSAFIQKLPAQTWQIRPTPVIEYR